MRISLTTPTCRTFENVVLNDGSAQCSMVKGVTVTFSDAAVLDAGAIELRRQDGSLVDAGVNISLFYGKTVAVRTKNSRSICWVAWNIR